MPSIQNRSSTIRRRARRALLSSLAWFVLGQLVMIGFLEWQRPEFYDPKYGCRLNQLRLQLGHDCGQPLLIVLGTSRAEQGFRPRLLPAWPDRQAPLVFNLARGGSSPLLHLLTFRRLLADGIHPDGLLVEIFPPSLSEERSGVIIAKPTVRDFPLLRRSPVSWKTYAFYLRDRALLWHKYRSGFLDQYAPTWVSGEACWGDRLWAEGGEWLAINAGVSAQERRTLTADAYRRYHRKLQDFHIAPAADRPLRELLDLCQAQGIRVMLFLMPEASEFRAWYPPAAVTQLSAYLAALQREYGIPLIDARGWIADEDFYDGHHLLLHGATAFTHRFGAEVFQPYFVKYLLHTMSCTPTRVPLRRSYGNSGTDNRGITPLCRAAAAR
jgi:hypothetical protein